MVSGFSAARYSARCIAFRKCVLTTRSLSGPDSTRGRIWRPKGRQLPGGMAVASAGSVDRFCGATTAELQHWLAQRGVDTTCYGQGCARSLAELLQEVERQECVLSAAPGGGPAQRSVQVLSLLILNSRQQVLYEEAQVLPDGRTRRRNLPLSEKLIGKESWRAAVMRAVCEELGSVLPQPEPGKEPAVQVFEPTYTRTCEVSASMSYPGIATQYVFHRVQAAVPGLPGGPFVTREERPGGHLISHWVWRPLSELPDNIHVDLTQTLAE